MLARCVAMAPLEESPAAGEAPEGEERAPREEEGAVDLVLLEGIEVLRECARGAVLALRACCPMILLQVNISP